MATNPKPRAPWGEYVAPVGRMTVEQFEQFPGAEGWVYELHEGRLIAMPGPGNVHSNITHTINQTLGAFLHHHQLGPLKGTSCYILLLPLAQEDVLCPDLSYIIPGREAAMPLRGSYLVGAPDMVIEIASPGDTRPELAAKAAIYLHAGVRLLWAIWPARQTIDVWRPTAYNKPVTILHAADTLDGLDVIPGFQCAVSELFR